MALALLVGWSLLRPAGRDALSPVALSLALVFGTTLLVGVGFPLARLGAPVTAGSIALLAALLTASLFFFRRLGRLPPLRLRKEEVPADWISRLGGLLLLAGLALFLAKLAVAPLWSWDHFAVWGVKSRRMVADGALDLGFLDLAVFHGVEPQYPLGLPFAWRILSLGALPGDLAFKACHALFCLALVAVTRHGLLLASGSRRLANALAAWLAVSPVLWDTIGVGHADLVLGLWAVTAVVLVLEVVERQAPSLVPAGFSGFAGLAAGFLPWIKQEGLVVGLAVLAASVLLLTRSPSPDRRRRLAAFVLPAVATLAASRLVAGVAQSHGVNFFAGRWWLRALPRLTHPGELLGLAAADLLAGDWLGIWIVFGLACILVAASRGRWNGTAAILCGLVLALLGIYVAVYFVTVLPPVPHLVGSFFRLLCPLTPLALLAVAALCRSPAGGDAAFAAAGSAASVPPAA